MTAVNVTREHIAKGVREDCELCPVALAILDAFPGLAYVRVDPDNIALLRTGDESLTTIAAPPAVLNFIWDYDDGGDIAVGPFTFTLDIPAVAA